MSIFHAQGCRLSDHGLNHCFADFCSEKVAAGIFKKALPGEPVSTLEQSQFASFMMVFLAGWTPNPRLDEAAAPGAMRNNNTRLLASAGGRTRLRRHRRFSAGGQALAAYLGRLDAEKSLPKTIVYNLNPADNYVFEAR